MKRLASAALWLVGLLSLAIGVLFVFLGSGTTTGFAMTLLASSGLVVSGLILCGLGAILDALLDLRDRI